MKIERFIPKDILKPFIKAFILVETTEATTNKILPGTSLVLAFRLKGKTYNNEGLLSGSALAGLTKAPRAVCYAENSATLLTIFEPAGIHAFFNTPFHELFNMHISLDNLIVSGKLARTEDTLNETHSILGKISVLEDFYISILDKNQIDKQIQAAVTKIRSLNGNIKIKDLADYLNISIDPFEKKFRRIVGTSPKHFSSIIRIEKAIESYSKDQSLTNLAYSSGFFDQAHFIREFKSFTGQLPTKFFKESTK